MSTSNIGHLSENLYSESNILWTQFESASLLWTILQIVHPTQNGAIFELIIDLKYIMCSWQNLQGHVQNYLYNLDPPKLTLNFFMMDEIPPFANNVFIKKTVQHSFFWPSNFFWHLLIFWTTENLTRPRRGGNPNFLSQDQSAMEMMMQGNPMIDNMTNLLKTLNRCISYNFFPGQGSYIFLC